MEWSDENMKPPFCLSTGTFSSISASIASASFHLTALVWLRYVSNMSCTNSGSSIMATSMFSVPIIHECATSNLNQNTPRIQRPSARHLS